MAPFLSRRTIVQALLLFGLGLTAVLVRPFLEGVLWGLVFSAAARPLYCNLVARLPKRVARDGAGVVSVLAALVCLAGPVVLVGLVVWTQLADQIEMARFSSPSGILDQIDHSARPLASRLGITFDVHRLYAQYAGVAVQKGWAFAMQGLQSGAQDVASMGIGLICQFFLLRDDDRWQAFGARILGAETFDPLAQVAYRSMRAILKGVVVVAVIQGVVMGTAYAVAGVQQWLLLMVGTTILSMIPLVGPPVLFIPVSVGFMLHGDWARGLGLLAFGAGVVSQIDNILRPIFIGNDTGLHPLVVFFGLLGGVMLLGPVGLFAGPVAIAMTLHLLRGEHPSQADLPVAN